MRRKLKWGKTVLAIALAGAMSVTSVNLPSFSVFAAEQNEQDQNNVEYLDFEKIQQNDYIDSGTDVNVSYSGNEASITGSDWGNDWGGDSKWQIQLKQLVPVTKGEKYTVSVTFESEVSREIFVKLGDNSNDDTVYGSDSISLKANTPYTYTQTTKAEVDIDALMVLFALGANGDAGTAQNTIKINNFSVKGEKSGYVKPAEIDHSVGKEHDFTTVEGDCEDPGTQKDGYDLVWADEFDGNYGNDSVDETTGLDLDKWDYQLGDGTTDCGNTGWGNSELQCYTGNKKNIGVNEDVTRDGKEDGLLRITASYEEDGYNYENETAKNYTSARIRTTKATEALFNTTYGYVESRMALPGTKGAWPAFWMLPQSTDIYGSWPVSGEIDIMETHGAVPGNDQALSTLHWGNPEHVYKGSGYTSLSSDYTRFHTYAVDWEPGKMTFYYDGTPIYTSENWESGFAGASDSLSFDAPYDQPYYLLLNLAVDSGQFGGSANRAGFNGDINMYVDYVRVYQRTDGYADSVERKASDSAKTDWNNYKGMNQIADVQEDNLTSESFGAEESADTSKWYLSYNSNGTGGNASIKSEKDATGATWAKIGITEVGSQDYSVQMIGHYDAKAGYLYKISFDAYADGNIVGKTVNCDSKEWSGWSTYGITSFDLTNTPKSYSYFVNQTEDFNNCRIEFNLGAKDTGDVYIGNVKVEIVDPSLINSEKEHKALSNGNVIYNGTFDQGINHIGYWTASEGTTLVVPRYTTEALSQDDVSVVDVASKLNQKNKKLYVADGVKYYERRAQISASNGVAPQIYQSNLTLPADTYNMKLDMYSKDATTFKASIYMLEEHDDNKVLGTEVVSKTFDYTTAAEIKNYTWKFDLDKKIEAAFVLTFEDGAQVQIDNVSLIGASLGEKVDPKPMDESITWGADQCGISSEDGANIVKQLKNGDAWYASQVFSSNFSLTQGNSYKLSFKYKLTGQSNGNVKYIIQENGGSWTVYGNGPTTVTYDSSKADKDGYCSYEVLIPANKSLKTVHMVFGFGHSEVTDDTIFSFKDVKMELASDEEGDNKGGSGSSDIPKPSEPSKDDTKPSNPDSTKDDTKPSDSGDKQTGTITGVKNSYTVKVGSKNFTLKAEGYGDITFASSNNKVASIDLKTGKVKVKGPGIVKITIKASGDDTHAAETKVITIKVAPKKAMVKSAKSKDARQLTIRWKRDAQVSGYEIQYSTSKNFKNAKSVTVGKNKTTSKSIDNLKSGKKYYIRIRSYKTVGKTKLNGSWSKTDIATTK